MIALIITSAAIPQYAKAVIKSMWVPPPSFFQLSCQCLKTTDDVSTCPYHELLQRARCYTATWLQFCNTFQSHGLEAAIISGWRWPYLCLAKRTGCRSGDQTVVLMTPWSLSAWISSSVYERTVRNTSSVCSPRRGAGA
jgi:hypothetical protein